MEAAVTSMARAFAPASRSGAQAWATLVAILGTTISPYLFFWQASQEVEEEKAIGRRILVKRQRASRTEIADRAAEVIVADYLARQPEPTTAAESRGRQLVADMAKRRVRPQVVTRVRLEIRRSVERAGVQATALVLPVGAVAIFRAFEVSRAGTDVWVTYRDAAQGPIRFRMSRQADRGWQISEFDPEWVRRRVHEEPARIR